MTNDRKFKRIKKVGPESTAAAEEKPAKELSFFEKTLQEMEVTPERNKMNVLYYRDQQGNTGGDKFEERPFFSEDESGNIRIHYYNLQSQPYKFRKEGNKWPLDFIRTRLKVPMKGKEGDDIKYLSPSESGMAPFFPPNIIDKYQKKEQILTLIITEGEKKAFKGYMEGLDIVGIPSIHGFYAGDVKGKMHEDLQDLIIGCKVEKIIFLTDADTLVVKWEKTKDLAKRQATFYNAVKLFRESLQALLDGEDVSLNNIYFAHINRKYIDDGKGLDDLLISYKDRKQEIIDDLMQFQFAKKYFTCKIITDGKMNKVYSHFGLVNEKDFYDQYKEFIGAREFLFRGRRYEWDGENVKYVRHEDSDEYMRVGCDWFRVVMIPNKHKDLEAHIKKWSVAEIQRDYKKFNDFIESIRKYKAFFNDPVNDPDEYQRVRHDCYNIYHPIQYPLTEGPIDYTVAFLKHLFGGQATIDNQILGDSFTVALDYLTIMYRYPKQILPVPCLVSPENNTGKSSFLKWLKDIFGSNATILGNEEFKMSFNSHYITKFIIGIDEGFIEVDKKADKERLKKLATDEKQFLQFKGVDVQEIDFYGKVIICSNDADRLMKIDEGEIRWFIIKVPVLEKEDPEFRDKLRREIPAWLKFLKHREIFHPKESRAWFKPEYLVTDQLRVIISATRSGPEKMITDFIIDMFLKYRLNSISIHPDYIVEQINKYAKYKISKEDVNSFLKRKKNMKQEKLKYISIPNGFGDPMPGQKEPTILWLKATQRPFIFLASDWLSEDDYHEFNSEIDLHHEDDHTKLTKEKSNKTVTVNTDDIPF